MVQVHHDVARIISDDSKLLQCARVVTWLEELARDSLQYNAEQGAGNFHTPLMQSPAGMLCTEGVILP